MWYGRRCEKLSTDAKGIDWSGFALDEDEKNRYPLLAAVSDAALGIRLAFLLQLGDWLYQTLRVVDLGLSSPPNGADASVDRGISPLADYFKRSHVRRLMFITFKQKAGNKALVCTNCFVCCRCGFAFY